MVLPLSSRPPQLFRVTFPAEGVAHVEFNRPEKLNAICGPMWFEMRAIFDSMSGNPEVRCILLSGAGDRAFTAGLDVADAAGGPLLVSPGFDPSRRAFQLRQHILDLQDCVSSISRCQKPVIALMHGFVYGAGIDISTACDIRYCASNALFSIKEVDIGITADVGTLARIGKTMGGITSFVKEVALTARSFSAEEALREGFVNRVYSTKDELISEGLKMASLIATKSPVAVQGTKVVLDRAWGRTVEENLDYVAVWNAAMLQSTDVERAMTSSLQKRKPTFEKL